MLALKPGIAALLLIAGLSGRAFAQSQGTVQGASSGKFANYPGVGSNFDYYSLSTGFGNYGLPGSYPTYGGNALSGYGPGAPVGAYFTASPAPKAPKAQSKPGGPMKSPKPPTVKPGSDKYRASKGISNPWRSR